MGVLRAVFELQDRYSSRISKIMQASDRAAASIEKASTAADKVSTGLDKVGKSGTKAGVGLSGAGAGADKTKTKMKGLGDEMERTKKTADRVAKALAGVFAVKTAVDVGKMLGSASDAYANANTRLNLVNTDDSGNAIDPSFQNKVYASAQRSRASFESTANGIASLGLNASSAFKNQDELIAFVESINKQFVIGGTEAGAAAGAMVQLTQAMGSGALRGDELNSVLEAAPSIARNIEKYMGWAEGSIKKYAEKGMLSAEMVKNAQLAAMDEIDRKFNSMPMTWAQVWTSAMNMIQKGSAPFLTVVSWLANNMSIIGPLLLGLGAALAVYASFTYGAAAAQWVLNAATAVWNALCTMNPAGLMMIGVIGLIAVLYAGVAAFNKITGASVSATGIICGGFFVAAQFVVNLGLSAANVFLAIANGGRAVAFNIKTAFGNSIRNVQSFFYNLLATATEVIRGIAEKLNALPFVNIDVAGLSGKADTYRAKAQQYASEKGSYEDVGAAFNKGLNTFDTWKKGWAQNAYNKGYSWGSNAAGKATDFFNGGVGSSIGTVGDPAVVKGTEKNGSIKASLEDEDISYLKELAERDYVARIAQNTLAPNIAITFTGDIHKETDYEQIGPAIAQILRDELETAPEGLY